MLLLTYTPSPQAEPSSQAPGIPAGYFAREVVWPGDGQPFVALFPNTSDQG